MAVLYQLSYVGAMTRILPPSSAARELVLFTRDFTRGAVSLSPRLSASV
jgi:hypothetical protein